MSTRKSSAIRPRSVELYFFPGDFDGLNIVVIRISNSIHALGYIYLSIALLTSLQQRKGVAFRFSFEISPGAKAWGILEEEELSICCLIVLYGLSMRPESPALL